MLVDIGALLPGGRIEGRWRVAVGVDWVGHLVFETGALPILAAHLIEPAVVNLVRIPHVASFKRRGRFAVAPSIRRGIGKTLREKKSFGLPRKVFGRSESKENSTCGLAP